MSVSGPSAAISVKALTDRERLVTVTPKKRPDVTIELYLDAFANLGPGVVWNESTGRVWIGFSSLGTGLKRTAVYAALNELTEGGRLVPEGSGKRNDAYRYSIASIRPEHIRQSLIGPDAK